MIDTTVKIKVLLIEDDPTLRENTAELLHLAGYGVITAANGKKGVMAAIENTPHIIVCDIMMPELDGYGVLKTLASNSATKAIPFIFLSAKTERKDVREGMQLGADDYLTKPFEEEELIGAIESRLARVAILNAIPLGKDPLKPTLMPIRDINALKNFIDDHGRERTLAPGEAVYNEGTQVNHVYLIINGVVKTHKIDETGKELITAVYKADDLFGVAGFAQNRPHTEFATAIEPTVLAYIGKEELSEILENNYHLALELVELMSNALSDTKDQLLEMAYGSVRRKTASTLLKFAEKLQKTPQGRLHVLRSDLASVAGMATESLIRTLSSFKKEGIIDIEDRNIRILDINKLRQIT